MREKLIDVIEYHADFLDWDRKEEMVDSIMEIFEADNNVGRTWIPVTDRFPEEDVSVLVLCKNHAMFVGFYRVYSQEGRWHTKTALNSSKLLNKGRVTHWMPLPEPPKEDDHEV